jgi:hypothetical protein
MHLPAFRHLAFVSFVFGTVLVASTHVHAQDCGGGGDPGSGGDYSGGGNTDQGSGSDLGGGNITGDSGSGNSGAFGNSLDQGWDNLMTTWNFFAVGDDPISGYPVAVTVYANPIVYAGSPTVVSSSAGYAGGPVLGHSIEYIEAGSSWNWPQYITYPFNDNPYLPNGTVDNLSINMTFPSPGTYYVRGGVSVLFSDGQNPWIYSEVETVTVNDPITSETVSIQTHPKPGMEKWVLPSHLVEKTFSVFHSNPQ